MSPLHMEMSLRPALEQRMRLAPQIIQSIEILQMAILDLQERIAQEMLENPVLEVTERTVEAEVPEEKEAPREAASEFERLQGMSDEWRDYFSQVAVRPSQDAADRKMEAMASVPAPPITLQEHLSRQLGLLEITPEEHQAGQNIIYNIDPNGYLRYPLEEIVNSDRKEEELAIHERMLRVIQTFDPPGVGARDLVECLLLQLGGDETDTLLERRLILEYLEDIQKNRLPQVAKKVGRPLEEIKHAVRVIGSLNPRPGTLFSASVVRYISPDVYVEYVDGRYEVRLEEGRVPHLYINPFYQQLLGTQGTNPNTLTYVRKKVESARWLMEAIEQRRLTLLKVAKALVEFQTPFLEKGLSHLVPLKMKDVADRVGVHISTVSRAVSEKYIQTPRGIYPMKFFFTGGTTTAEGELRSWKTVKQHIAELIENEDKKNPPSDDEIAEMFSSGGLRVARRTVTKYRKSLGIPSSRERKKF